ncbi:thiamine pyrophosphate-binding protein [Microbacteriaceae bacterium VKM Ac-2854]|nr:thiamine pyrophosphate-binding protein [Microbacteriaceae bacterium VKM Ac-2854]
MSAPSTETDSPWVSVARALVDAGVQRVYGLPGDDMAAVAALRAAGVFLVVTSEQRNAVYAAVGDAAVSRRDGGLGVGVVVAGRGPGAAALVPPLLEIATAGEPVVLLVGGAPEGATARSFQFAPQRALFEPLAKAFHRLAPGDDAAQQTLRAFEEANRAPAGPVVLEIPESPVPGLRDATSTAPCRPSHPSLAPPMPDALRTARHPVVLVGAGARGHGEAVTALARALHAPLLCTASGRGIVAEDEPLFWGLSGLYLHPLARAALAEADLLVVIGSRLEETAIEHLPSMPVQRLDIDPDEPGSERIDASVALAWSREAAGGAASEWSETIARVRSGLDAWGESLRLGVGPVRPWSRLGGVVAELAATLPADVVVCHENGSADMWSYLFPAFRLPPGAIDIAPSEQTTLGFGTAAASGAARAGGRAVVAFGGDGAFSMLGHERASFGPGAPGVVYVVFDNGGFGWLELQDRAVTGANGDEFTGLSALRPTDARGRRLVTRSIRCAEEAGPALRWALAAAVDGPVVLVVPCTAEEGAPVLSESW